MHRNYRAMMQACNATKNVVAQVSQRSKLVIIRSLFQKMGVFFWMLLEARL